jgi:type II secretory pathway component GspD/PulD (secretin)
LFVSVSVGAAEAADSFDFKAVDVSTAISLYLSEVSKRPYMLCGDVLADTRKVSIRASGKTLTGPLFASLLAEHGFAATDHGGVMFVCKMDAATEEATDTFLYRVKHRDSAYLVDLLSPLVKGTFANRRAASSGALTVGGDKGAAMSSVVPQSGQVSGGGTYKPSSGDDYIVFSGSVKETAKLQKLLDQVDTPTGEVVVKAYMYEVGSSNSDASALGMVLSALSGKVQGGVAATTLGNFVRLKTASIDLIASALKTDGRFKVVTAPYQRVRSGKSARFVSGSQVSVLGAIVTNQNGSTQQSFDRIESGTILEISPVVHGEGIDVDLFQQVSSFVTTDASSQPTLNKREFRTMLTVEDGEVVLIAGLDDSKEEESQSGLSFLPFSLTKSKAKRATQLILLMEIKRL